MDYDKTQENAWEDAEQVGRRALDEALGIMDTTDEIPAEWGERIAAALVIAIANDFTKNYRK